MCKGQRDDQSTTGSQQVKDFKKKICSWWDHDFGVWAGTRRPRPTETLAKTGGQRFVPNPMDPDEIAKGHHGDLARKIRKSKENTL